MSKYKNKFLIGSDPEFMVVDSHNHIVSCVGLLPGYKEEPFDIGQGCSVQVDNVMAEFCLPPTDNPVKFHDSLKYALEAGRQMLPKGYNFLCKASHSYPEIELNTDRAKEFGCEPDYNPYPTYDRDADRFLEALVMNTKPTSSNPNLRSCGGHIHIDLTKSICDFLEPGFMPPIQMLNRLSVLLDYHLGVPSLLLDSDKERRLLYGKAGAYRPKEYGLEYRTLSNFWLQDLDLIKWVFDSVDYTLTRFMEITSFKGTIDNVENIINEDMQELAQNFTNELVKDGYQMLTPITINK
jgi:hypothetical protein